MSRSVENLDNMTNNVDSMNIYKNLLIKHCHTHSSQVYLEYWQVNLKCHTHMPPI